MTAKLTRPHLRPGPPKTMGGRLLLSLPADLRAHAERAATRAGVSLSEWIRRAMAAELLRAEARRRGVL